MSTQQRNAYKFELDRSLQQLLRTREQVAADKVDGGGVKVENHYNFEESVMVMRQRLLPFVDRNGPTGEIWTESGLHLIPERCARKVGETEPKDTKFGIKTGGGKPIIEHAPIEDLELWADAMVEIYAELGFTPETADRQIEASGEYSDILD